MESHYAEEIYELGEWVTFRIKSKTYTGHIVEIFPFLEMYRITVPNRGNYRVPCEKAELAKVEDLTQGDSFLIDLALSTGDQAWFEHLTASRS